MKIKGSDKNYVQNRRIIRHIVQILFIILFFSPTIGYPSIYYGTLISSSFLGIELSDPLAVLENIAAHKHFYPDLIISGFIVLSFFILIGGRFFCGWVCPYYLLSEIINKVRNYFAIYDIKISSSFKYWFFISVLILSFILSLPIFEYFSPPGILLRTFFNGLGISIFIIISILLIEIFISKRVWCKSICPIGALYSIAGKFSKLKININKNICTNCIKCHNECIDSNMLQNITENAKGLEKNKIKKFDIESVKSGECTYCFQCYDVCPKKAISFGWIKANKN
ncbi:MAG: 4Fe-4S binding protein [Spirochaetia bacterium]|nr:4Fe-4S binding protein [Spirochaetia bacterium]